MTADLCITRHIIVLFFYFYSLMSLFFFFFFFNDTATTEIYTLSLHDALPISAHRHQTRAHAQYVGVSDWPAYVLLVGDRKSTRLNSSHSQISYAVFCLKKKKKINTRLS